MPMCDCYMVVPPKTWWLGSQSDTGVLAEEGHGKRSSGHWGISQHSPLFLTSIYPHHDLPVGLELTSPVT